MRHAYPLAALVLLVCLTAGAAAWTGGAAAEQPVHRTPVATTLR